MNCNDCDELCCEMMNPEWLDNNLAACVMSVLKCYYTPWEINVCVNCKQNK
jgi:hypothetical protein